MRQIFCNMINFNEYKRRFVSEGVDVDTMCNFLSVVVSISNLQNTRLKEILQKLESYNFYL
jgi:3'-phosphoadenosine 5'-phosphosulfate sulfotransferase